MARHSSSYRTLHPADRRRTRRRVGLDAPMNQAAVTNDLKVIWRACLYRSSHQDLCRAPLQRDDAIYWALWHLLVRED